MTYEVHNADCLNHMRTMPDNAVDAVVTDPPYGLTSGPNAKGGFMGKEWDAGVPGEVFWREALRVAKPGAHLLAFGGTRTFHRLTCAIEDAGWEIRDCIMYIYGSGFPKSLDVSKAIDKAAGAKREVIGHYMPPADSDYYKKGFKPSDPNGGLCHNPTSYGSGAKRLEDRHISAPATDLARQWQGWGTCLKPAFEPIILARKPLDGTVASTVAKWGTGGLNVDGCRVETGDGLDRVSGSYQGTGFAMKAGNATTTHPSGRFPANLVHDGSEEVLAGFPVTGAAKRNKVSDGRSAPFMQAGGEKSGGLSGRRDPTNSYDDLGGSAARFFYCAKASRGEREAGLREAHAAMRNDGRVTEIDNPYQRGKVLKNHHPTVKPIALMRWLVRLVTPPDGLVLDPFTGSGTTGCAAVLEGKRFVGCELSAEYADIARARIAHHAAQGVLELEAAT
jgi:DNA modification methylase